MTIKAGDNNFANYVGWQAFSSDEPTHRINKTNWYLKYEHGKPAFFLNAENVYKQMPDKCFKVTASAKSKIEEMAGYQEQLKHYFNNLTMEDICQTEVKLKKRKFSTV